MADHNLPLGLGPRQPDLQLLHLRLPGLLQDAACSSNALHCTSANAIFCSRGKVSALGIEEMQPWSLAIRSDGMHMLRHQVSFLSC